MLQAVNESRQVVLGIKAQAVHTRIQLQMNREIGNTLFSAALISASSKAKL